MYCFCLLQTLGGAKKMVVPKGLYIYGGVGKRPIQNRQDARQLYESIAEITWSARKRI